MSEGDPWAESELLPRGDASCDKIPGRNPPETVERRPEPTPAPPLPKRAICDFPYVKVDEQRVTLCSSCGEPLDVLGTLQGMPILGHKTLGECEGNTIKQILAKLDHIPCVSEDCDGPDDGEPVTKDQPSPTRCHRCAAVRLGRSVLKG